MTRDRRKYLLIVAVVVFVVHSLLGSFRLLRDPEEDVDAMCLFRDSSLYRSIYVYPSPGDAEWKGSILSPFGHNLTWNDWPWLTIDNETKTIESSHYHPMSMHAQFSTEILVRDILTHPDSCLRTYDPEEAKLFFVPYFPSMEFHAGKKGSPPSHRTSPFAQSILDILEKNNHSSWERQFGLSSKYWRRREGADHILVFSEPLQGLTHPKNKRGSYHFIHTQKQLTPPIVISVELSTTFVRTYPKCTAKNILLPYPITDGRYYNGNFSRVADIKRPINSQDERPLLQWYKAGIHGSCVPLRNSVHKDYKCSETFRQQKALDTYYSVGMRLAKFCPCTGGDTASAKRMFDAVLTGCIPIILSHDFVWPLTDELPGDTAPLKVEDFSLRWNASEYSTRKYNASCQLIDDTQPSLEERIRAIPASEVERLQEGLRRAARIYSYYRPRPNFPWNPLRDGILPDGDAALSLVRALEDRASGERWNGCQEELLQIQQDPPEEPTKFVC